MPQELRDAIMREGRMDVLKAWHKISARAKSVDEFIEKSGIAASSGAANPPYMIISFHELCPGAYEKRGVDRYLSPESGKSTTMFFPLFSSLDASTLAA